MPNSGPDWAKSALERILHPPLGLPAVPYPETNPPTIEKIKLGRKIFNDIRLSKSGIISCASCHFPKQGFAENDTPASQGFDNLTGRRNAPSLLNAAYFDRLFHDGRETALETQFLSPLVTKNEMANPSVGYVIQKIKWLDDYDGLFEQAFRRGPSADTIGEALASYERTLLAANSRFDQWKFANRTDALTKNEKLGFKIFSERAKCVSCHQISETTALFTDNAFHDIGYLWMREQERHKAGEDSVTPKDLGRYEVTGDPLDRWRIRTPSLRNIELTSPYMHDGRMKTLEDVVRFYNKGGAPHEGQDIRIRKLDLSDDEIDALVAFLKTLTGSNINELISEALAGGDGDGN